jgi:hypothetical protein
MFRFMLPVIVLLAAMLGGITGRPASGSAAEPIELNSVTIELPYGDMAFPPGPGVEAASRNCLFCHSAGMVLYQPALSKEVWTKEVDKMIKIYKAPVNPDDIPAIVDYLMHIRGAE